MKHRGKSRFFGLFLSLSLLVAPLPLSAVVESLVGQDANAEEYAQNVYIYLEKDRSNIADIMSEISELDEDEDSPINLFTRCCEEGASAILRDEMMDILEYAYSFLESQQRSIYIQDLTGKLDEVITQVLNGDLNIDEQSVMRSNYPLLRIRDRIIVYGKSHFKSIVIIDGKLRVHGRARFYKHVHLKDGAHINGTLSVDDIVAETLDVDSISVTDLVVDNLTVNNCMDSLCVTDLSAVDASISGTLSVADLVADSLSIVDGIIGCDLTVGCNISLNDSTSASVGNIVKGGTRFMHNFGTNNTFVGKSAGNFTTTGTGNTALGVNALTANTTGVGSTAIGFNALAANTTGINTAVGLNALAANTTGNSNTAVGTNALAANIIGIQNTAVGISALAANTASFNTGVGLSALAANTIGTSNTGIGANALLSNTTGQNNTALAVGALQFNITGQGNTAVGNSALALTTGDFNTAVGFRALTLNTTGINTAVGSNALLANTTGTSNTAVGFGVLTANTIGTSNTGVGASSLAANTTGVQNTALGFQAAVAVTTGTNNTIIGYNVGVSTTTGNNNVYIDGNSLSPANESDTIRVGNTQTRAFVAGVRGATTGIADAIPVLIDSAGQLGTISSSKRFKHNIEDMSDASTHIFELNPVTFAYNEDVTEKTQFGLIAEEVDEVLPALVIRDADGLPFTVRYDVLPVMLLNEMKKQQDHIVELDDQVDELNNYAGQLENKIDSLESRIDRMENAFKSLRKKTKRFVAKA